MPAPLPLEERVEEESAFFASCNLAVVAAGEADVEEEEGKAFKAEAEADAPEVEAEEDLPLVRDLPRETCNCCVTDMVTSSDTDN